MGLLFSHTSATPVFWIFSLGTTNKELALQQIRPFAVSSPVAEKAQGISAHDQTYHPTSGGNFQCISALNLPWTLASDQRERAVNLTDKCAALFTFSFYQRLVVRQQDYGLMDGLKSNIWGHDLHHTKMHHVELLHKVEEVLCLGVFSTMRKQVWAWTIVVKMEWSHKAKLCIYLELSNPKGAKLVSVRQTKDHGKRPCLTSDLIFRSPRRSGVAREREIWNTLLPMQSDPLIIDCNVDGIIVGEPVRQGRCLPPAWRTLRSSGYTSMSQGQGCLMETTDERTCEGQILYRATATTVNF